MGISITEKPVRKSLFVWNTRKGNRKKQARNHVFATRNLNEISNSGEYTTATISQMSCRQIINVRGCSHTHKGMRVLLTAINIMNTSRNSHINGSSGREVDRALPTIST